MFSTAVIGSSSSSNCSSRSPSAWSTSSGSQISTARRTTSLTEGVLRSMSAGLSLAVVAVCRGHYESAMRRSSGSAARSVSRSAVVNSRSNSSASQPSRRARVVCSRSRPAGVSSTSARRPSPGSGRRETSPADSRSRTVCAMDCGRMRSPAARSLVLAGPSRSRRPSTAIWPTGGWPPSARTRRMTRPRVSRNSWAMGADSTAMRRSVAGDRQAVCTGYLYSSRGVTAGDDKYKWIALSNATLAVLLATLDGSITIIAMPDIFRGIGLDPLVPSNSFYLLWMILGYLVVTSVLIVSLGRLGDMVGRVKIYNLGFVIYTVASLLLAIDWMTGRSGATFLIVFRIVQGIGGACLLANAAAIITDAFPARQRGMALGINNIVGVSGMFIGLVLGGILAPIDWRLVFLISVPVGLFGTVWAYVALRELSTPRRARVDWAGNLTFAVGLVLIMVAVTYGI